VNHGTADDSMNAKIPATANPSFSGEQSEVDGHR
jgi:hypothetical protein